MDESFDMLSSMSPKIKRHFIDVKTFKKPPTRLALKQHIRRSSISKLKNQPVVNDSIIVVESGSSSSSYTTTTNSTTSHNKKQDEGPIEISDSMSTSSQDLVDKTPEKLLNKTPKDNEKLFKRLSQEKFDNIRSWLNNVSVDNNVTGFTDVSAVFPEDNSGFRAPDTNVAASSTFITPLCKRFDELFEDKEENKKKEDSKVRCVSPDGDAVDCTQLESLHSGSSEVEKSKEALIIKDSFDEELNQIVSDVKQNCVDDSFGLKINESWGTRLQKMFLIADTAMNNKNKLIQETEKTVSNLTIDSTQDAEADCKNLLDSLYGAKWRKNEHHVLPSSEPRKKSTPSTKVKQLEQFNTDRPRKNVMLKKPSLKANNENNTDLKKLQTTRRKVAAESPWQRSVQKLCDPDTDSSDTSIGVSPIKLNFLDDIGQPKESKSRTKLNFRLQALEFDSSDSELDENLILKTKTKTEPDAGIKTKTKKAAPVKTKRNETLKNDGRSNNTASNKESYSFLASLSASIPVTKCDMSARIFRINFKQYRDELMKRLFKLYNEKIFDNKIPEDSPLEWSDRMTGTAGSCYCRKITHKNRLVERKVRIVLSSKVIDSADRMRDTLVHEMCHAATWIVNEVSDGHGPFWKSWANRAMATFPELPPINRCHQYIINTKYTYKCTGCGYSIGRHTKSLDTEKKRCGYCYGKFEVLINKTSKKGETKSVSATPKREATGFARFVKENYATCRTPELKHGDVMKILGQKFGELKVAKS